MMQAAVRYHDLVFGPDMLTARRDDGTSIRLTRLERALLLRLVRQPGALVTRAQLLASLAPEDETPGERSIDYLVNRLRGRLGDNARAPRFIATQYGEGYLWLAEPVRAEPVSAFLLVGPVFGLSGEASSAPALLEKLAAALRAHLSGQRVVLCRPGWRPVPGDGEVAYSLEVALHEEDGTVHMALVLREGRTRAALRSFRLALVYGTAQAEIEGFADTLVETLWKHAALPAPQAPLPADDPAHLRLHNAAAMFAGNLVSWRENEPRLRGALAENPGDPRMQVLLALTLYARLIQNVFEMETDLITEKAWNAIEDEIENLALAALPVTGNDPQLLLGIAKVLFFIDRGYLTLAERLTGEAFRTSTAFSAVFSMKGQIAAARGDIDDALGFYDKAIEMVEPGSQFHIYLLVLKATALLAAGRREALDHLLAGIGNISPVTVIGLGPFFASPRAQTLPDPLERHLDAMDIATGRRLLTFLDRVSGRHFQRRSHRRTVLRGLAAHLVRRQGPDVIPPALSRILGR